MTDKIMMYSDESCYIKNDGFNCMSLATIYLKNKNKDKAVIEFKKILKDCNISGEIKWSKVSPSNVEIYINVINKLRDLVESNHIRIRTLLTICDKTKIIKEYSEWYDWVSSLSRFFYFINIIYRLF